jgi:hypothetical protein
MLRAHVEEGSWANNHEDNCTKCRCKSSKRNHGTLMFGETEQLGK